MDPYLEDNEVWPGFHQFLATQIAIILNRQIRPKYYADLEVHTVQQEVNIANPNRVRPDTGVLERIEPLQRVPSAPVRPMAGVAIAEAPIYRPVRVPDRTRLRTVKIFKTKTSELVTSIEILSPYNKQPKEGLDDYQQKRRRILSSSVHFIEIDLLRGGRRPGTEVNEPPLDTDYVLLVNREQEWDPRVSEIWPVAINEPLPVLPVPLLTPDPDVPLDMGAVLREVYENATYETRIDYQQPVPPPKLRPPMAEWIRQNLPQVGEPA